MIHGKRWAYMQGCRCAPCRLAESSYKREWAYRTGRSVKGRRGISYSRCGVKTETVLPELVVLLKMYGSQHAVAQALGISDTSMYRILIPFKRRIRSRMQQRIRLSLAQRITELARGGRALVEEHHQAEIERERNAHRAALKKARREKAKAGA